MSAPLPESTSHPPSPAARETSTRQVLSLAGQLFATIGDQVHRPSSPIPPTPPNIADPFTDLLSLLDPLRQRGMISWIATRYYDGWHPDRAEIADLVAVELGVLRIEESIERQRRRNSGDAVPEVLPRIRTRLTRRANPAVHPRLTAPANPQSPRLTPLPTLLSVGSNGFHQDDPL